MMGKVPDSKIRNVTQEVIEICRNICSLYIFAVCKNVFETWMIRAQKRGKQ